MHWTLDRHADPPLWLPTTPLHRVRVAMTTRRGGVSPPPFDSLNLGSSTDDAVNAVAENRRRTLVRLGLDPSRLATAGQVHGAGVTRVSAPGFHPETDALVTRQPQLALAVTAADCLPIAFVAPAAVAVAHCGWRGTVAGLPRVTLEAVCDESETAATHILAFLGPCIGPCCYRVGEDVASRFPATAVVRDEAGPRVDLAAASRLQLLEAGVPADAIAPPPACTSCSVEWCFSHRRDAGATGRLWGVVAFGMSHSGGRV